MSQLLRSHTEWSSCSLTTFGHHSNRTFNNDNKSLFPIPSTAKIAVNILQEILVILPVFCPWENLQEVMQEEVPYVLWVARKYYGIVVTGRA